ncbi:Peroxisomal trans-2-enoyl-CoA reductase [Pseudolycoriella hygida]|uniref:Peroxisomal trans-2-enoyl-CoA reductase n=1 Tax=Pseudolycoriella hygida TaxID=35572 RepID=A0A9Q0S8P6_9DIPT|nr:Peroxisomal trans-2-enoyl-CoA reductase [Pseudolycoriella hygida]
MSIFKPGLFKGNVAIVTGGGTGIGRAITYELLTLGCKVVIASRNHEKLENCVKEFKDVGEISSIVCNIRKEDEVRNLVSQTLEKYGKLDFLVNNGGGQFLSPAADITLKGWNAVIETNLTGTFLLSKEAYNQWFHKNGGSIVNIIADMWRGFPMMSHTGAARHAVHNLTQSLAIEWAEKGVRVNSVAPGIIESPTAAANYKVDNVFKEVQQHMPSKRPGLPGEVASAVCFLLSPGASFISGTTLKVDCGSSLYTKLYWEINGKYS